MHYCTVLAISVACLLRLSEAQTIDPSTVSDETKTKWCNDQKAACPLLCLQQGASDEPTANDCTDSTLVYSCICSNGLQPNASEYSQTIPFYECQEAGNQCVARCPKTDSACQTTCRTANPCGAQVSETVLFPSAISSSLTLRQNPTRVNTSTISTMSATRTSQVTATSATDTDATAAFTGFGAASTTGTGGDSSDAKALAIGLGRSYGLAVVFIGISAGFTFLL
ncbi:MAG: hypothetical protein Q9207_000238 [Kuettlingeria erythrocarpa]